MLRQQNPQSNNVNGNLNGTPFSEAGQFGGMSPFEPRPENRPESRPENRPENRSTDARFAGMDVQRELNKMEELILDSPRVPMSRRTIIDEEQLLEQLDLIRLNLPSAFQEATEILVHKEDILLEAEQYAQEIIAAAEQRATQIVNDTGLVRQAEMEAQLIRQQVQQECEAMQQQALAEVDQIRRRAQQDLEEMQRMAIAEAEDIQNGADDYADRVLRDMEDRLSEMTRIVQNGRQQVRGQSPNAQPVHHNVHQNTQNNGFSNGFSNESFNGNGQSNSMNGNGRYGGDRNW
jgi:F0F1-type ATP synthase membrane subunit b/b'